MSQIQAITIRGVKPRGQSQATKCGLELQKSVCPTDLYHTGDIHGISESGKKTERKRYKHFTVRYSHFRQKGLSKVSTGVKSICCFSEEGCAVNACQLSLWHRSGVCPCFPQVLLCPQFCSIRVPFCRSDC